jgi:hypothetical protein
MTQITRVGDEELLVVENLQGTSELLEAPGSA